jgi:hypothetical protein
VEKLKSTEHLLAAVANGWVYIDGGEISYRSDGGNMSYRYCNALSPRNHFFHVLTYIATTLEAIDLSQDWTNSTVSVHSIPKPDGVPDLIKAGLWYDDKNDILYSGFAGRASFIGNSTGGLPPYPLGIWSFQPNGDASGAFNQTIASTDGLWESIIRPCSGLISYGAGKGYILGGASCPDLRDDQLPPISGLLEFDMATRTLVNSTVSGSQFDRGVHMGGMLYVPNYGTNGIFVVIGGEDSNLNLLPMDTISLFDPTSNKWYTQHTTGDIPRPRKSFCVAGVASSNGTYEMYAPSFTCPL